MFALLKNSFQELRWASHFVMIGMITAQMFALFVTISLGASVTRTNRATHISPTGVITGQQPPTQPPLWTDWTAFMESDATMEDALVLLLNSTRFNPYNNRETVYTQRKYDYVVPCNETSVALGIIELDKPREFPFLYPSPYDDCDVILAAMQSGDINYSWDVKSATSRLISAGEHMMVAPIFYVLDVPSQVVPILFFIFNGHECDPVIQDEERFVEPPEDGMISIPITNAVRCQYNTSDSLIMGSTYIKFAVNHL